MSIKPPMNISLLIAKKLELLFIIYGGAIFTQKDEFLIKTLLHISQR
jgi:hypothetical protein